MRTPRNLRRPEDAPCSSFAQAIDVSDIVLRHRRLRRQLVALRLCALLLLAVAVCVAGYPYAMQWQSDQRLESQSSSIEVEIAGWPYPQAEDKLKAARAYNRRLAKSGQPVLGEAVDPFSTQAGASRAENGTQADSEASKDTEYQGLLNARDGVMAAIRIPQLSIDLPVYHGTSEEALARGAGHLYGTSLPVGGKGTHSVITGHRGLVEALMFTRIDEMHEGDFFYIDVMGETLAYQVDRISVIEPDDTSKLRITPGEDRVTLMTCTPYGVNTHRLLVSGRRVSMPNPAPDPTDVRDARTIGLWTGLGTLAVGWTAVAVKRRRSAQPVALARHAKGFSKKGGWYGR